MLETPQSDTSFATSTQRPTDTLIGDSSVAIVDIMSCKAIEGNGPNISNLLGTNAEALILSYNADGTWHSLL